MESELSVDRSHGPTSQDIWYEPPSKDTNDDEYVVYIVPGNPCLMAYYQPFASTLFASLNEALAPRKLSAHVGGYTLPGFELQPSHIKGVPLPASLQSQIKYTEELIKIAVGHHVRSKISGEGRKRPKVILVAHSAGTYITLEILRRLTDGQSDLSDVDIVGSVLICPSITHLADSRNGAVANILMKIPAFPDILGILAKLLTFLLPLSALSWVISVIGRMPPNIAQAAAEFMKGPYAVRQALHLLREELREIKEDTWTEGVWGSPNAISSTNNPLKICFAKHDVWASPQARDALIASRGRTDKDPWKPEIIIDDNMTSHSSMIDDGESVAKKTTLLIEDIITGLEQRD